MNSKSAAEAAGLAQETLRYYERVGVLPTPPRRANGYRDYATDHIAVIQLAKALRQLGLPLRGVRDIVQVAHDGVCAELRTALIEALDGLAGEVDRRVAELIEARQRIDLLREGLRKMQPRDERVPSVAPCECVESLT